MEKIRTLGELKAIVEILRKEGKRVVWTNGCFDLLHVGHINYLREAREKGDFLIIGLNDDTSVKLLKGPYRPILPVEERAEILSSLYFVDAIIPFSEKSPKNIFLEIKPDVFVKGGDYSLEKLDPDELNILRELNAEIFFIGEKKISTTDIIKKIKELPE